MLLPWLAWSCQMVTDDYDDEIADNGAKQYINVTISVSADKNPVTRSPLGGEYGDGSEKGQDRENEVNNITLIFYEDNVGINTTADATVACVQNYAVRAFTESDYNALHSHKPGEAEAFIGNEVLYTTGDQQMEGTGLEVGKTYKLLVVANSNGRAIVHVGDKIKTNGTSIGVRDQLLTSIYDGTVTGISAENFVMASETDAEVTLANPALNTAENKAVYYFNCIHMERLSARIDFCTKGAVYDEARGGYKYLLGQTENDGFYVVTKVTPFNLYNEQEYLFKRVVSGWDATNSTVEYLGNETLTNYVADPKTTAKTNATPTPSYLSTMAELLSLTDNPYTQVMADVHTTNAITDDAGFNNIIIAYPRENTLLPTSLLKTYATGIAFEAQYYSYSTATPQKKVFYHYLRHQGENTDGSAYKAQPLTAEALAADDKVCGSSPAMNFGIVRNNIYRVEITGFNEVMELKIKVKKWDKFTHEVIYL
jgi:hypothetical protein